MTIPIFADAAIAHIGQLNLLPLTTNALSVTTTGAVQPRSYVPMVKLRRVAAQNVPVTTNTLMSWDTVDRNNDSMFTLSSPTQVTIQTSGSYALDCEVGFTFSSGGNGWLISRALLNGTVPLVNSVAGDVLSMYGSFSGRANTLHIGTQLLNLTAGNVVYIQVYQDTGASTLATDTILPYPSLSLWRTGP